MSAILMKNVSKIIKGKEILSNINLDITQGSVCGFFGSNGSGKSMLFRMISGLIKPTKGKVTVFEKELGKDISFPESLGMIIENVGFWPYYSGFENLKTLASIRNTITDNNIKETIERVGLNPNEKMSFSKYSLGMKQRLGIAQAIMEKPSLIILDEPTNALDEDGIAMVRDIIKNERDRGATILISSHHKEDLTICDRLFQIKEGQSLEKEVGSLHED